MAVAIATRPTTTNPLAHLAQHPPPISASQSSLLLLPRRSSPVYTSLSTRSRLLAAVAAKEPELGGGGRSGGGDGSGGPGGGSDPREGGKEGEGEEEGEKEMAEGMSMSQKLTLAYAALVGGKELGEPQVNCKSRR